MGIQASSRLELPSLKIKCNINRAFKPEGMANQVGTLLI